ncbi:MAG: preprotein translocase subunit SecA [Candidatus Marisimplicoccus sp.]|tara:strand:- start:676 stop:4029 length:3354 start_codon:yes stop_codon:yes gene_type:complete
MSIVNSLLKVFLGDKSGKDLKKLTPLVDDINIEFDKLSAISNDQLRNKTIEFKGIISEQTSDINKSILDLNKKISNETSNTQKEILFKEVETLENDLISKKAEILNDLLPQAFAVVKETAKRFFENEEIEVTTSDFDKEIASKKSYVNIKSDKSIWKNNWDAAGKNVVWDMIHYDVQLIGGIVLHQGRIGEMQTGEGKTLVSTLPIYLNALTGDGVHLVTVNDYLAKRDSAWMGPILEFHGLRIDCIDFHKPNSPERKRAYDADITYGTNNEFGFDYLRDNMSHSLDDIVQRKHNYAIIDEVDSVLIDDARTPLIISGPTKDGDRHEFDNLKPKIQRLVTLQKTYLSNILSEAKTLIKDSDNDQGGFLLFRAYRGLPKNKALIKFLSEQGVKQTLQKTENFYMQDNNREMHQIDEELYFTIDEKNNQIELTDKGIETLSQDLDDKDFFIMPNISTEVKSIEEKGLSSEEEAKAKSELFNDFDVKSERIHSINQLLKAFTLFEKDVEYVVVENKVMIVDEQTGRIMDGRRYSDGLHQAIEAKENVKIEAATQTFATITLQNYFRLYTKLSGMTGTAVTEAGEFWEIYKLDVTEIPTNKPIARKDEDDLIYKSKREKYNAIIEDVITLRNNKRPVLIGTTSVEISELLSKMLSRANINHNVLNAKLHKKEADIVTEAGNPGVVTIATNMAGRGTDIKLSKDVINSGGLAIIGTERHDSRRVDRQLRGRSGRQGDPGSSQFYVSFEDNLMRLFGQDRVSNIMDRMGLKDGENIQHPMVTKSIERAQKKVEENNFGIRKRLLEYDDVMNSQRNIIYTLRKNALEGDRLQIDITNIMFDTIEEIVIQNKGTNDYKNFEFELITTFSMTSPITENEFLESSEDDLIQSLYEELNTFYTNKKELNRTLALPIIKNVYENKGNSFKRIVVPFTDGKKVINIVTDLKKSYESNGENLIDDFEKNISLAIIDEKWKNHLRKMDDLKQSVQLAVHEQKDPLLIYKFEAYELFKSMIHILNKELLSFLFKSNLPDNQGNIKDASSGSSKNNDYQTTKQESLNSDELAERARRVGAGASNQKVETVTREIPKIGRNEKVEIKNSTSGEVKAMKFKQAEKFLQSGEWEINS